MRTLSRATLLIGLAAIGAAAPPADAASTLSASLSPNKGGSLTVAAPTTFGLKLAAPDAVPYDNSGNTQLKAIKANMPTQLLFNTTGFTPCPLAKFLADGACPSASKLGSVKMTVDAGPDFAAPINATTDLWFGGGFTVLAFAHVSEPATMDSKIVGELRSSGATGYGLQIYIPIPPELAQPIERVYPVVRTMEATVTPPTRSVKVPGETKKVKLPLAGLGICSGALNFGMTVVYTDATRQNDTKTDPSVAKANCKK